MLGLTFLVSLATAVILCTLFFILCMYEGSIASFGGIIVFMFMILCKHTTYVAYTERTTRHNIIIGQENHHRYNNRHFRWFQVVLFILDL